MLAYPESRKSPVTDEFHGIPVKDDYRWLEDSTDPAVKEWTAVQNQLTRARLDRLSIRQQIYSKLKDYYSATSADHYSVQVRAGRLFALKLQPPIQQPFLVVLSDPHDPGSEKTVVDPNQMDPSGRTAIDFYTPSLDGRLVAACISLDGSEDGSVRIFETDTGRELGDVVPRVNYPTGGGSLAWLADGSGFFYTRYPYPGERSAEDNNFYQQVWQHTLGTPSEEDRYVLGAEFPRIAEIELSSTEDGRYYLALVRNGDGGEMNHYVLGPAGVWRQVTRFEDRIQQAVLGPDEHLYLLSRQEALRGKILRIPLSTPQLEKAVTIVPEQTSAIEGFEVTENLLYVVALDGGPSQLSVFDHAGIKQSNVPLEPVSSVWELAAWRGDEILFRSATFITPPAWQHYNPRDQTVQRTVMFVTSPADFSDCEVVREYAVSRDGTRVPINIIRKKGAPLDRRTPLLLNGYGGYGISLKPYFQIRRRIWLDMGGIIVIANLRGGGEYGDAWHLAGNLTNKQNVFDDFTGCARHVIQRGYTSPERLCIEGGSNGGLLMGAAFTQHPELYRAVVSHVGIYDMLRVELDPNGAFNITEFGTVTNPQHFEAIYEYSPYHAVEDGAVYPAILFTTGEHDGRVNPAQSRKMTARMQAASQAGAAVLLRTSQAGHGMGTALEERIAEDADVFAFLYHEVVENK